MKKVSLRDTLKKLLSNKDLHILFYLFLLFFLFFLIFMFLSINTRGEDTSSEISTETISKIEYTTQSSLQNTYISNRDVASAKIIELSYDEAQLLMKLAWSEAGNQGIEGQLAVMNVVLNRVNDENFPDTIKDVIYQKCGNYYQFSVVGNGVFKNAEPTEETHLALADLEGGKDISQGALYFEAVTSKTKSWHKKNRDFLFEDYGQRFYR